MNLDSIFPDEANIPAEFKIDQPVHQKEYLINGEIHYAKGEMQKVYSPVFTKENGKLIQKELGSFPLLTEKEANEALEAAVNADTLLILRTQAKLAAIQQKRFALSWSIDTTKFSEITYKGFETDSIKSKATGLQKMFYNHQKPFTQNIKFYNK